MSYKPPTNGEVFPLFLNPEEHVFDATKVEHLNYKGSPAEFASGLFKLVNLNRWFGSLEEVKAALASYGTIPSGLWVEALNSQFAGNAETDLLIAIADDSWEHTRFDGNRFPILRNDDQRDGQWKLIFNPSKDTPGKHWYWLVQVG